MNHDDYDYSWEGAVRRLEEDGLRVLPLNGDTSSADLGSLSGKAPPPSVVAFTRGWSEARQEPWQVLVTSIAAEDVEAAREAKRLDESYPVRRLVEAAEYAAIVCNEVSAHTLEDMWTYLLYVRPPRAKLRAGTIRLHRPATHQSIAAAEAVLGMRLPPSYIQLLRITNGLGVDDYEWSAFAGAGPQRADWDAVTGDDWLRCQGFSEIAACWRLFQGVYADERQRDAENGENTFASDERVLVPFLGNGGGDEWCLDRSRQSEDGECAIVFWDHELREASDDFPADETHPTFARWLDRELERAVFEEIRGEG
jgi:SMI1/KNR4 family protein SUKH-1